MTFRRDIDDNRLHSFTHASVRWRFFTGDMNGLIDLIGQFKGGGAHTIAVCNVHMFIESNRDRELGQALCSNSFAICDGQPIAWLLNLLTGRTVPRITGPDLFVEILQNRIQDFKVALVGGNPELLRRFNKGLTAHSQNLLTIDPGRVSPNGTVTADISKQLQRFNPDIVFVGLGCPKQEKWMHNAAADTPAVYIGVGAAFEYLHGDIKRAPNFLGRLGLEWLYRLIQQPRLLRRYASSNFPFLPILARAALNQKHRPS